MSNFLPAKVYEIDNSRLLLSTKSGMFPRWARIRFSRISMLRLNPKSSWTISLLLAIACLGILKNGNFHLFPRNFKEKCIYQRIKNCGTINESCCLCSMLNSLYLCTYYVIKLNNIICKFFSYIIFKTIQNIIKIHSFSLNSITNFWNC